MNIVDKMFSGYEDSLAQFDAYRTKYANCNNSNKIPVNELLIPWAENKHDLYQMFGEKLILTKEVEYERPYEDLYNDMEYILSQHYAFINNFFTTLANELHITPSAWRSYPYDSDTPNEKFYYMCRSSLHETNLITARLSYDFPEVIICNERIRFARGQKIMRAINKLANLLGLSADFERFRIAHSMVLNQAKLKGTLHLSIHPLDYATASDNVSGWSSCMSWSDEGSYRLGTVEMMTSPYVVCAYLASDSAQMDIGEGSWASKKWRAWVIVTPDFIVVNRNYPYDNDDLMRACVDLIKPLAEKYYNVTYDETTKNWNQGDFYYVEMNYMYNDLSEGHMGCYALNVNHQDTQTINISGPAICMCCGQEIEYYNDDDRADMLTCAPCANIVYCHSCETPLRLDNDEILYDADCNAYCETCYTELFSYCEHCGNTVSSNDFYEIILPINYYWVKDNYKPLYIPSALVAHVCRDCLEKYNINVDADLSTNIKLPFEPRNSWDSWYGYILNPNGRTWEDVCELFNCDSNDQFGKLVWEYYASVVDWN